jgi:hypothetical protein
VINGADAATVTLKTTSAALPFESVARARTVVVPATPPVIVNVLPETVPVATMLF